MSTIAGIAVNLSANISAFASGMTSAGGMIGGIRSAFDRATDSAKAYKNLTGSIGELKLAGRDTVSSLQTTFAVARSELQKFANSSDVKIAVEWSREQMSEAWLRTRPVLQSLVERTGIKVAASIVSDKTQTARAWIERQRRALVKPITVRVELARRAIDQQFTAVRSKLESLKQYRAVRITLAAVNATKLPVQAALATLGPLRRLATTGVVVALRATHFGIAAAVTKARSALGGLSSFGRSVASSLSSGFALVGAGLAALGAYSFTSLIKGSLDSIDALKDQADALGVSTDALSRLNYAASFAGVESGTMNAALGKMLKGLDAARSGSGAAADAFRLLGLDAAALANLPADEAFREIAGAMQSVENSAQRTAITMDLFGKSGAALLPVLANGKEGLAEMAAEADRLGVTVSATDAAKVEAAVDAMDRMKHAIAGATDALAVQLAPFIQVASDRLTEFATSGEKGLVGKVVGGFEAVVSSIAYVADYLSLAKAGFKLLQAGATLAVAGIVKAVDLVGSGLTSLMNLLPGVSVEWSTFSADLASGLLDEAAKLKDEAGEAFGSFMDGENSKAVTRAFDSIRASSAAAAAQTVADGPKIGNALDDIAEQAEKLQKVGDQLDQLKTDVNLIGLGEIDKEIFKLRELGATDEQLQQARGLLTIKSQLEGLSSIDTGNALTDYAAKLETLTKLWGDNAISLEQFTALRDAAQKTLGEKLADQAKSVIESVKSPLEAYQEELEKLQTLLERGLITQDVFDKAQKKAQATLDSADKKSADDIATPKALRAGSADAQRLAYDAARGVQRTMGKDEIAKKQLTTQEQMARSLSDIARSSRADRTVAVEEVTL